MFPSGINKNIIFKCIFVTVDSILAVCCFTVSVEVINVAVYCLPACEGNAVNIVICFAAIVTSVNTIYGSIERMSGSLNYSTPINYGVANFTEGSAGITCFCTGSCYIVHGHSRMNMNTIFSVEKLSIRDTRRGVSPKFRINLYVISAKKNFRAVSKGQRSLNIVGLYNSIISKVFAPCDFRSEILTVNSRSLVLFPLPCTNGERRNSTCTDDITFSNTSNCNCCDLIHRIGCINNICSFKSLCNRHMIQFPLTEVVQVNRKFYLVGQLYICNINIKVIERTNQDSVKSSVVGNYTCSGCIRVCCNLDLSTDFCKIAVRIFYCKCNCMCAICQAHIGKNNFSVDVFARHRITVDVSLSTCGVYANCIVLDKVSHSHFKGVYATRYSLTVQLRNRLRNTINNLGSREYGCFSIRYRSGVINCYGVNIVCTLVVKLRVINERSDTLNTTVINLDESVTGVKGDILILTNIKTNVLPTSLCRGIRIAIYQVAAYIFSSIICYPKIKLNVRSIVRNVYPTANGLCVLNLNRLAIVIYIETIPRNAVTIREVIDHSHSAIAIMDFSVHLVYSVYSVFSIVSTGVINYTEVLPVRCFPCVSKTTCIFKIKKNLRSPTKTKYSTGNLGGIVHQCHRNGTTGNCSVRSCSELKAIQCAYSFIRKHNIKVFKLRHNTVNTVLCIDNQFCGFAVRQRNNVLIKCNFFRNYHVTRRRANHLAFIYKFGSRNTCSAVRNKQTILVNRAHTISNLPIRLCRNINKCTYKVSTNSIELNGALRSVVFIVCRNGGTNKFSCRRSG